MNHKELFSENRLRNFKDEKEHRDNFLLMQSLSAKLGVIEIITRNKILKTLIYKNRLDILDNLSDHKITDYDNFISKQTFGFWGIVLNKASIQNDILNLRNFDFRKYSKFNQKCRLRNYVKVRIVYDLLIKIRNRAFHFENLYKLNKKGEPRIQTYRSEEIIGIAPEMLNEFLDDILICFDKELKDYLNKKEWGKNRSPFNFVYDYITNLIKKSIKFIKQRSKNETNQ